MNGMTLRRSGKRGRAGGNALLLALLALVVIGLGVTTAVQTKRLDVKRQAGVSEAAVMERIRDAAQALVDDHLIALQRGEGVSRHGVALPVDMVNGSPAWQPTLTQLRDMGYLPSGWTTTQSLLNGGTYRVALRRTPAGCAAAACDIVGNVVLTAPIRDGTAAMDGVVIGPILSKTGADGGVSLPTNPALLVGFNGTWQEPNPIQGTPTGIVAMRFGTQASRFGPFVRIGDDRDPALTGNLTVAGAADVGGGSRFRGELRADAGIGVGGTDPANPCTRVEAGGAVTVGCGALLTAAEAQFGQAGARTEVGTTGIRTEGGLRSAQGLETPAGQLFGEASPTGLALAGNEFSIDGPTGRMATFADGRLHVPAAVATDRLLLQGTVSEGSPCGPAPADLPGFTPHVLTTDGSLATCLSDRWMVSSRYGRAGAPCQIDGYLATDSMDGRGMVCRNGRYVELNKFLSRFVLADTLALQFVAGPINVQKPVCPVEPGETHPLIILTPNNEAVPGTASTLSGINRYALDAGDHWEVHLETSADSQTLPGTVIAHVYCFFA